VNKKEYFLLVILVVISGFTAEFFFNTQVVLGASKGKAKTNALDKPTSNPIHKTITAGTNKESYSNLSLEEMQRQLLYEMQKQMLERLQKWPTKEPVRKNAEPEESKKQPYKETLQRFKEYLAEYNNLKKLKKTSYSSRSYESYEIEVSYNDEFFIINDEKYKAQSYCSDFEEGDEVIFLEGSPLGACASAELLNLRNKNVCDVWCE